MHGGTPLRSHYKGVTDAGAVGIDARRHVSAAQWSLFISGDSKATALIYSYLNAVKRDRRGVLGCPFNFGISKAKCMWQKEERVLQSMLVMWEMWSQLGRILFSAGTLQTVFPSCSFFTVLV